MLDGSKGNQTKGVFRQTRKTTPITEEELESLILFIREQSENKDLSSEEVIERVMEKYSAFDSTEVSPQLWLGVSDFIVFFVAVLLLFLVTISFISITSEARESPIINNPNDVIYGLSD